MRTDINFDRHDDPYDDPKSNKASYVILNDDHPHKFYQNPNSFCAEYPEAYVWDELKYAKVAADRAAKKFKRSLIVIENYGLQSEKQVYIAYLGQQY